jgi:AmpD protein
MLRCILTLKKLQDKKYLAIFQSPELGELVQFVSTQNKAWHAGVSSFMGRENAMISQLALN